MSKPNPEKEAKALSLVPQIQAALEAVVKAGLDEAPLEKAIELGKLLQLAKDAVGHGQFGTYLEKYFPKFSHRTANVYMQVAEKADHLRANWQRAANLASDGKCSIRTALLELRTDEEKAAAKERAAKAKVTRASKTISVPATSIEDIAGDLDADEVFTGLRTAWGGSDREKLEGLYKLLGDYLRPPARPPVASAGAGGPPNVRAGHL